LEPVVQVIWSTVNMRPATVAMESGKMTISHAWKAVHTHPTWRATINKT
jgi:hypothetical protein